MATTARSAASGRARCASGVPGRRGSPGSWSPPSRTLRSCSVPVRRRVRDRGRHGHAVVPAVAKAAWWRCPVGRGRGRRGRRRAPRRAHRRLHQLDGGAHAVALLHPQLPRRERWSCPRRGQRRRRAPDLVERGDLACLDDGRVERRGPGTEPPRAPLPASRATSAPMRPVPRCSRPLLADVDVLDGDVAVLGEHRSDDPKGGLGRVTGHQAVHGAQGARSKPDDPPAPSGRTSIAAPASASISSVCGRVGSAHGPRFRRWRRDPPRGWPTSPERWPPGGSTRSLQGAAFDLERGQRVAPRPRSVAPMAPSGPAMRSMGAHSANRRRPAVPPGIDATSPARRRIEVPELPQSRSEVPARSRERPPSITTGPPSATVMAAPRERRP